MATPLGFNTNFSGFLSKRKNDFMSLRTNLQNSIDTTMEAAKKAQSVKPNLKQDINNSVNSAVNSIKNIGKQISGKSNVKGEKWINPLAGQKYTVTDHYDSLRNAGGKQVLHGAIDLAAAAGTKIKAAKSGRVIANVTGNQFLGNAVVIRHHDGTQSRYAHLKTKAPIKEGTLIKQGDIIGQVGNTGFSTGPHLDFMIGKDLYNTKTKSFQYATKQNTWNPVKYIKF
jgi:murein DD-endopeptidase MepM/ murein hydrolase activator NlpD